MLIILSILFSFLIVGLSKRINCIKRNTGVASAFLVSFWFYYALIPFIIGVLSACNPKSQAYFSTFMRGGGMGNFMYFIVVTIFVIVFFYSYTHSKNYSSYEIDRKCFNKYIKLAGYIALFGGGLCLIIYFHLIGGLTVALSYAEFNRSFALSMEDVVGQYYILFRPAKLVIVAPFCFSFLYLGSKSGSKKLLIYFLAAIIFAFCFYLYDASRSSLMIYLVALSFPIIKRFIKHPWFWIFVGGIIGLNMLNVLDSLFVSFATGEFEVEAFDWNEIIHQFSHPYRNVCFSYDIALQGGVRFGKDFIADFLNFIPGVNFDESYEQTCVFYLGPDWRTSGGIPNDIITFSVIEFFFFGIIIIPYLVGIIIKKIDVFFTLAFQDEKMNNASIMLQAYLILLVFFNTASSDFAAILQGYSLFVFSFIPIYSLKKSHK